MNSGISAGPNRLGGQSASAVSSMLVSEAVEALDTVASGDSNHRLQAVRRLLEASEFFAPLLADDVGVDAANKQLRKWLVGAAAQQQLVAQREDLKRFADLIVSAAGGIRLLLRKLPRSMAVPALDAQLFDSLKSAFATLGPNQEGQLGSVPGGVLVELSFADFAQARSESVLKSLLSAVEKLERSQLADSPLRKFVVRCNSLLAALEFCGSAGLGVYLETASDEVRALHDLAADLVECRDVLPVIGSLSDQLKLDEALALKEAAWEAGDIDPSKLQAVADLPESRGLRELEVYLRAREILLSERLKAGLIELKRQGFEARLSYALSERAFGAA